MIGQKEPQGFRILKGENQTMSFKLAIIGAGSLVFARTLFTDIMSVPEFRGIDIAFTDINADNLE